MEILPPVRSSIPKLARYLRRGEVIVAPTETAYGLLADACSARAVAKVFRIKGRVRQQTVALVVADLAMAKKYGQFSAYALKLAKRYWPSALTLVVKAKGSLAKGITKNGWVGMRVPAQAWLRRLVKKFGRPVTATSANRAGGPTPYTPVAVRRQLESHGLTMLVDGGRLPRRAVSTVVRVSTNKITVLRQGAIKLKS